MADIKVINLSANTVSEEYLDLDLKGNEDKFGINNLRSVSYVLNWQLSKRRSGTAQTKIMSEISGTTAKPHKQKGTGHARQGSKRSVQFRGGRTCFGPRPRSFEYRIPKK